jgi:alpha-tubulin suppressor-like RCC1 family protein
MRMECMSELPTLYRKSPARPHRSVALLPLGLALVSCIAGCACGGGEGWAAKSAAGLRHTLIIKTDGSLWGCGDNTYGKLGVATASTNQTTLVQILSGGVAAVAAGHHHTLILKTLGSLWGCGQNSSGQLGDGSTTDRTTPVQVMTDVAAASGAILHSLILKTDGTLWACGSNTYDQVGATATENPQRTPVQVLGIVGTIAAIETGGWHSLALTTDGRLYAWGRDHVGQLGDGTTSNRSTPAQVATGVSSVSAGQAYTLILKTDGSVWGCGENNQGQLCNATAVGGFTSTFTQLIPSGAAAIAAAGWTGAALRTDGTILTWGLGLEGELGNGTNTPQQTTPVEVPGLTLAGGSLAGGGYHFVALPSDGSAWLWGLSQYGQLGDGVGDGTTISTHPTPEELNP